MANGTAGHGGGGASSVAGLSAVARVTESRAHNLCTQGRVKILANLLILKVGQWTMINNYPTTC